MARYYELRDGVVGGLAFCAMLILYVGTMAPTVSLEQSGALVVAADHAGIGKFPGFPLWHLLGFAMTRLFSFVTYHGNPNPAWATNMMSAIFGALACGTVATMVSRLTRGFLSADAPSSMQIITSAAALSAAFVLGVSPTMWSQSVVTETHTLTLFYFAAFLAMLLAWSHTHHRSGDLVISGMFGLGLSISPFLVLFAPVTLLVAATIQVKRFTDVGIAMLALFGVAWTVVRSGSLSVALLVMGVATLVTIVLMIPSATRRVALLHAIMAIGLTPYVYFPLASMGNPPMNMGYAKTWEGFLHLIGRGQYERIVPVNPFTEWNVLYDGMLSLAGMTSDQFMLPLVLVGIVPLLLWPTIRSSKRQLMIVFATFLIFSFITTAGLNDVARDLHTRQLVVRVYLPVFCVWAILIGCGFVMMYDVAGRRVIWKNPGGS